MMAPPYALLSALFLALPGCAEHCRDGLCQTAVESQAASILQKDSRLQRLVSERGPVEPAIPTKQAETPMPVPGPLWHWITFVVVITVGALFGTLPSSLVWRSWPGRSWFHISAGEVDSDGLANSRSLQVAGSTQASNSDALPDAARSSKESTADQLQENSHLLDPSDDPEAAESLLALLPESEDVAVCRDGVDAQPVTYAQLRRQLQDSEFAKHLCAIDRVALVLENGKEMAICLLAVMHHACAVPLNPNFTEVELVQSFEQLRVSVVITSSGSGGAAAQKAATQLQLRCLTLQKSGGSTISLQGEEAPANEEAPAANPARPVLLLKTSGTTSRGKVVPFSLRRLSLAARLNARSVELASGDVCLSMMPLYHIAGISVNFLASLSAGATVLFYTGQFEVTRFVAELEREDSLRPSWYFAVPAVHEAVLRHAGELGRPLQHRLKLIRSAGAALAQPSGLKLIETFRCAVTPAYGMTEALEITCPPATYDLSKPGSVGPSISAEIRLVSGEVCIRGALVMEGYEHLGAPEDDPNNEAWTEGGKSSGFLRTGDLGYMDSDGWLYLTGRSKEMINRGGETINPHEVEPALASTLGVDVAVCFASPHQALGECIAAAIALEDGVHPEEVPPKVILEHCEQQLSEVMRPEVFVYLPRSMLPTTATKKFIRAGLSKRLGLHELLEAHGPGAFQFNAKSGEFEATLLPVRQAAVRDSLGRLREATAREAVEQQLKDALLGLGILQVITKHWFEGRFPKEIWSFWIHPFQICNGSGLICMILFFTVSGHSAANVTSWPARRERWLGLYMLMTLTALPAFQTDSMRVDWFFFWLLAAEILTVAVDEVSKLLPTSAHSRQILAAAATTFMLVAAAARTGDHNYLNSRYFEVTTGWGCSTALRLTDSWCNLLFANFDFQVGTWRGGQLWLWAAGFCLGFFALPRLGQELWSSPLFLHGLSRPSVRILALLLAIWLLANVPMWPYDAALPWWPWPVEPTFRVNFLRASSSLGHALAAVAALAVAVGPNNWLLRRLGRFAMGTLATHTLFATQHCPRFYGSNHAGSGIVWPLHDVLQPQTMQAAPWLMPLVAWALPACYILSVGKWSQSMIDVCLQWPVVALAFPLWLSYVALQTSTSALLAPGVMSSTRLPS